MVGKKTKVIPRDAHPVSRKDMDQDAVRVMKRLRQHGFKAYLVGGSVRDLLLGREPKDFDISTDAEPKQIKRLFRNCFLVGRRFRLAHIRFAGGKVIETSTFRRQPEAEQADGDSLLQWNDNHFGTPKQDAFRRDFTVNGLFYDPSDFSIIDHVGGVSDLRRGLIRSIGDPNIRFREDPVRMIRAVRFAARLGFRLEARTRRAVLRHAPEVAAAAPARLLEELYKLFGFSSAEPSFYLLWELGLLRVLIPELDAHITETGGKKSSWWRRLAALDSGQHWQGPLSPSLMLAVLLEDPIRRRVEQEKLVGQAAAACMQDWLDPLAQRMRIPKGIRFRLLHVVEGQFVLEQAVEPPPPGGRRKKRYQPSRVMSHASFPEALALLEIRAASGQADLAVRDTWKEKAESRGVDLTPKPPPPSRRRRKRRPRRRKPTHDT